MFADDTQIKKRLVQSASEQSVHLDLGSAELMPELCSLGGLFVSL